jgi:hypothetical protein
MDPNEETRAYLSFLLDHEDGCMTENCPMCHMAQTIYDLVRSHSLTPKWPVMYPWDEPTTVQ